MKLLRNIVVCTLLVSGVFMMAGCGVEQTEQSDVTEMTAEIVTDIPNSEEYLAGCDGEFTILTESAADEVILGPYDYDGDVEYADNVINTYKLADDAEAYTLYTYKHIKDGEVIEDTVDYQEITRREASEIMQYGGCGFVWFNDDLQIEKILIYGDTIFEE